MIWDMDQEHWTLQSWIYLVGHHAGHILPCHRHQAEIGGGKGGVYQINDHLWKGKYLP